MGDIRGFGGVGRGAGEIKAGLRARREKKEEIPRTSLLFSLILAPRARARKQACLTVTRVFLLIVDDTEHYQRCQV